MSAEFEHLFDRARRQGRSSGPYPSYTNSKTTIWCMLMTRGTERWWALVQIIASVIVVVCVVVGLGVLGALLMRRRRAMQARHAHAHWFCQPAAQRAECKMQLYSAARVRAAAHRRAIRSFSYEIDRL